MRRITVFSLLIAVLFLTSCTPNNELRQKSFFAMDTYITVEAYGNNAEAALNSTQEKIIFLERLWSVTDENSEIYSVNHSNGNAVELSDETAELLSFALNISAETDGALDCTLYPVLTRWGFTTGEYQVPDDKTLSELLENTGYEKVQINGNCVTVPQGMQLDLGAVGKGYAGDLAAEVLRESGVGSALLNLGGNIHAIGSKSDGTPWRIGLRSPFGEGSFATIEISDRAVITSGGYERYFTDKDGREYHHILNPETGKPAQSGLVSVTIIGSEGWLCDGLSTAVFVMGLNKAEQLWRQRNDFEMVLVADNGKIYITEGLNDVFSLNEYYSNLEVETIYQ